MPSAHEQAKQAITELRDLARGIHPVVLTDRGLPAALATLAGHSHIPVELDVQTGERPAAAVEAAAYFVVAEALTNANKHSGATKATVRVLRDGPVLRVERRRRRRRRRRPRGHRPARPAPAGGGARRGDGRRQPARRRYGDRRGAAMRVVIAEDLALLRDGLTRLLRDHGMDVVAAVEDGDALVRAVEAERPDVAVTDVRLPPGFTDEGLRAAIEARRRVPGTPVLVISQYVEQTYAVELLADGGAGVGYLLKDRVADPAEFVDAVRRVAAGGTAMDPEVVAQLVARRGPASPLPRSPRASARCWASWRRGAPTPRSPRPSS